MCEPFILPSARKHSVADADMLHAWRNRIDVVEQDDDMSMLVGPDQAGRLLEVGVIQSTHGAAIAHAMPARRKYLRR